MIPGLNAVLATIGSGGGAGGIGTNFILNGVMKQPAIITNGLSVIWSTNANGHVQAAVSLVDSNIPSTIARLDSPVFTGTVTFSTVAVSTLQVPFASRYAAANASSNLVATSDGASWTNLNGSSIASGTVADARIDAALARLASPTFTGDPKAPTASPGDNDTSIASTAFVTAAVAAGGGSGGTGTVVTASGGSDMSRANITTNGFGLLVTQAGTNILLSTTNNYPAGYYAGGFLPLFAGVSNALTGDLSMDQSSDVRLFMSETSRMLTDGYEVMGLRAYNGKLALYSFATNDLSAAEEFMVIDPSDLVGPTDIITFPNSGFNNKVVFEADVELDGNVLATTTSAGASNTVVATTAYVDRAVASGSDGTWDGTPIASGTITNLTISTISQGGFTSSNIFRPNRKKVVLFEKEWVGFTLANAGLPEIGGAAFASGTITAVASETNHQGLVRIVSSTSANSGYYFVSLSSQLFATPLLTWESITRVKATNAGAQMTLGFTDNAGIAAPVDGIRMWRSNNFLIPQIYANSVLAQGYEYPISSNQFVYTRIQVNTNMTSVDFYAEDSDTGTLILSTNLAGTLPASSGRVFSVGFVGGHTNNVSQNIEDIDWTTAYIDGPVSR